MLKRSKREVINTNAERGEASYAYCLESAGQHRLQTEVDQPSRNNNGTVIRTEQLEGRQVATGGGVCGGGIALQQGRFGCAVTGCFFYLNLLCLSVIGFKLQLTFKYSVVCTASGGLLRGNI